MNIKQLESIVAIANSGSFAAAAEALGTTQSAISTRIKELEKHFGVPLFDRSQHRARLTPRGEELLPLARQMLRLAQRVTRCVSDPDGFSGLIRIGAAGLIAKTLLPQLLVELRRRFPNVSLRVQVHLAGTLAGMLRDGSIDIALTTAPVAGPEMSATFIGHEEFSWLASPSLASPNRVLTPKDVEGLPVLGFSAESHHFPVISRWFSDNDAAYAPVLSSNNMDLLASLAAFGAGVAVLPRRCYAALIGGGRLRVLKTSPEFPRVDFVAAYRHDALLHPLTDMVATLAAQLADPLPRKR